MANNKLKVAYNSPVGRIVQGDPFIAQDKDQKGNLRVVKSGPNIGQPNPQFYIGLAIPKSDPLWPVFMQSLYDTAKLAWPAMFPAAGVPVPLFGIQAVAPVNPLFTFKVKDGDGMDRQGKSNATKEGFAGHWVVSAASSYAPKCAKPISPGVWQAMTDGIKRGDWARLAGSFASNESTDTPGMYINLDLVEFAGLGDAILSGPDFATAFATPAVLPAGVSATPTITGPGLASAPVMLPGAGGTYAELIAAGWTDALLIQHGKMAAPVAAPPPTTVAPPPAATVAPPPAATVAPPPAATVAPPPAAAGPTMLPGAGGTYAELIAAGWTDALLVQHGKMAAPDAGFLGGAAPPPATTVAPPPTTVSAPPATVSPTRTMTAAANGATYEQMVAAGWSDAQLTAGGYMILS